ncbi:MAG: hypothetical protein DRI88_11020 [Bacteroidetes bacterium]|nr:MAG: hypothetical protein DRI72_00490 [Bacteroidota bacterium]RLD43236.1 MAG: hypothetical protein DRI88_11020 [Bacteroidota bacterium]RLD84157.1 MAG: hypothetical protein DRJ02_12040 [Bacteroidota bacterium]
MRLAKYVVIALVFLLSGCVQHKANKKTEKEPQKELSATNSTSGSANEYIALNDSVRNALIVRGKDIARKTTSALQKHLKKAIKEEGLEYAVNFCYTKAMELTDSVSEAESVTVRRLAKKYRNPVNETDPEESELFKSYILEWLGGRPLSPKIIPDKEGHPVFYDPMYVGTVCLNCHGEPGKNITPELMKTISELYPEDKATNFKKGQPRGMWAITFTEYKVK